MRILLFENQHEGHRLHFVRMCAEAVTRLGKVIFVTAAGAPQTDEFRTHIAPLLGQISIDAKVQQRPIAGKAAAARMRFLQLRNAIARHMPDHVYVPYADGLAQTAGAMRLFGRSLRRRGMEVEGILMRGRFAYPRGASADWRESLFARAWLAATSLAPFDLLHHLDPMPYEAIIHRGGSLAARSRLIPEPVEPLQPVDRREARRRLNVAIDGRIICCAGWLDERKGVDRLIRAFAAGGLREDDRLLLVGRVEPAVRRALDDASAPVRAGRIIVHEGCVSDEHLHLGMSAADVVCVPYPRHVGSSGIIVRAAALQRMLLASDYGWVGMVTRRFGLGMMCDCADEQTLARSLPAALDAAAAFQPSQAAERFTQFHTQENFARHISARLRERLGQGEADQVKTWSWVMQAVPRSQGAGLTAAAGR